MPPGTSESTVVSTHTNKKPIAKIALIVVAALLLMGGAMYGVYAWQKGKADNRQQALQQEVDTLKTIIASTAKDTPESDKPATPPPQNVSYKTKTGALTLTVPSAYAILVNVDGNKGGAPGATLRVGKVSSAGIITDNAYEWVETEVDQVAGTLAQDANAIKAELSAAQFSNITITDTTHKSMPAKLVTAHGMGYAGQRRIYVVRSGAFRYQITQTSADVSKVNAMLQAVLDGAAIK